MVSRIWFILPLLVLAGPGRAQTERTLFAPVPLAPTPVAQAGLAVSEDSARRSLALGFAAAAAAQAERLVAESTEGGARRDAAVLVLAAARLELGDAAGAGQALAQHSPDRPMVYRLRAGLVAARLGQAAAAQAELAALQPEGLPAEERAWLPFLQGMVAELARDQTRAGAAYEQALAVATSDWQRTRLRLVRERLRLAQGEVTENQANALRDQAERYAGRGVGTDYAIQYAVALSLLGRKAQGIAYLQTHVGTITAVGAPTARDDARLMLGMLAGPGSGTGRSALEQLLTGGSDAGKQRMALSLLAEGAQTAEAREQLRRLAARLSAATPAHVLSEELLLVRAELALADRSYGEAEAGARELLTRFPASPLRARAFAQLAATAWELRRFRTAADYAGQAAGATDDARASSSFRLLAAEASYRAAESSKQPEDYRAAGESYALVSAGPPKDVAPATILFQWVMSELGAGRVSEAAALIDGFATDARFDATTRWQAEWNLARGLQAAGQSEAAWARVTKLRAEPGAEERPAGLRARLAWLEARLAQDAGRAEDALRVAQGMPAVLEGLAPRLAETETGLLREVGGLGRLVEAEALFTLGRSDEAVAVLKALRAKETDTEAAMQSYLVEADYQAAAGRLVEAQGLLTGFADQHREHDYAPYAIFQAALNAERRGEDAFYKEAYVLLEGVVNHPKAGELVFAARLKQGDLLRRLGDFASAQQIYEVLVNQYAQHPDVLTAQLALADCHRAQANQGPSHFESAITILERLRDLVNAPLDLRAEAGFKLGDMLAGRESRDAAASTAAALAVWAPVKDALATDAEEVAKLGARGRYWTGRLLVRMAAVLEQSGRNEEAAEVYRLLLARGLPGASVAAARLAPLGAVTETGGAGAGLR